MKLILMTKKNYNLMMEVNTLVKLKTEFLKEKVLDMYIMEIYIKEILKMVKWKEKVYIIGQMVIDMKVN